MTHEREIERVLDLWLADGPTEAPDRVFDVVIDRIERQSQRPAWRLPRRVVPVSAYLKPVTAIAAVVILAVVGFNLLPLDRGSVGGPPATASPSPNTSATMSADPSAPASLTEERWDELEPGTYIHDQSEPAVTMDVPTGWWLTAEVPWGFGIRPEAYTVDEGFRVWYDMRASLNDADCPEKADPSIGHEAADLIAEFTTRSGVVATAPQPISIGGLEGQWTDLSLEPDWTGTCPIDPTLPSVTLFTDEDPSFHDGSPFWGIGGTERLRVIALDDTKGSNVLIVLSASDAARFDAMVPETMPVIETFEFATAP